MTDSNLAPRRQRRGIYLLPNLTTTAALFAGFYAIVKDRQRVTDPAVFRAGAKSAGVRS